MSSRDVFRREFLERTTIGAGALVLGCDGDDGRPLDGGGRDGGSRDAGPPGANDAAVDPTGDADRGDLPSFVPAPGTFANIGLNTLDDVWLAHPSVDIGGAAQVFVNWCGGAYGLDYSTYGAMFYRGGGHAGGSSTTLYAFDFTDRRWAAVNGPPHPMPFREDDTDSGAPHFDMSFAEAPGEEIPHVPHTYGGIVYLPASAIGNRRGAWMQTFSGGSVVSSHLCDLDTGRYSRAASNAPQEPGSYGAAVYDSRRNRVWYVPDTAHPRLNYLDLGESPRTWRTLDVSTWTPNHGQQVMAYVSEEDLLVALYGGPYYSYQPGIYVCPLGESPLRFVQVWDGTSVAEPNLATSWDWVAETGKFYGYTGRGRSEVFAFSPPAGDWLTGTWSYEKQTLTGADGATPSYHGIDSGGGVYGRFRYVPPLRSFGWCDRPGDLFQLWRPHDL